MTNVSTGESSLVNFDHPKFQRKIKVEVRKLDSYCFTEKKNGIKIDVEGNEFSVIKGSINLFDRIDWLIIELNKTFLKQSDVTFESVCKYLESNGFKKLHESIGVNYIFIKK